MEAVQAENIDNGSSSGGFANFAMQVIAAKKVARTRDDEFLEKYTNLPKEEFGVSRETSLKRRPMCAKSDHGRDAETCCDVWFIDPFGNWCLLWLCVASLAVVYNYWTIIFRIAFVEGQGKNYIVLIILDYATDVVFLLDIWIQLRTGFMENGLLVNDDKKTRRHYTRTKVFRFDIIVIIPFDLFYFAYGINPMFRLGRLVKIHRFVSFYKRVEVITNHHSMFSLAMLIHHVFLIIHWVACVYFLISKNVGFGSEPWVYPALHGEWMQITRQYLYCFYLSSVTMTYVGNVPAPKTAATLFSVIIMYLIGVIVFAMIVGSACDMITNITAKRDEFNRKINQIKTYMVARHVPSHLQKRVVQWFDYLWMENIDLNDENTFEILPDKFKVELLLHVNLDTLKKVKIFEDCEPPLLRELVIRLQPTQCCSGDFICQQGEVGSAMYIVNKGQLEVVVDGTVVAMLSPGNHFGEISILGLQNVGNKRTATIRSVGFSQLFKLSKNDLNEVLTNYPNARQEMEEKCGETLKKDRQRKKSIGTDTSKAAEQSGSRPADWLSADSVLLRKQAEKIKIQLREKKLRLHLGKIKKQKEDEVIQMISAFVQKNPREDNSTDQEYIEYVAMCNQRDGSAVGDEQDKSTSDDQS